MCKLLKLFIFVFLSSPLLTNAQTVEEIKTNPIYIWGEGSAITNEQAKLNALQDLTQKITPVSIQSLTTKSVTEVTTSSSGATLDNNVDFKENFANYIQTYSATTLPITSEIIISDEPKAIVLKYIKQTDLYKIFEQRLAMIKDYVSMANKFRDNNDPGNALKYYNWAYVLLKSHPDCNAIKNNATTGELLFSYLPMQINDIFSKIKFSTGTVTDQKDLRRIILYATYNDKPAASLDIKYQENGNYTNPVSMKDGIGQVEFYGALANTYNEISISCDYLYYSEAISNKEMKSVLNSVEPYMSRSSFFKIRLDEKGRKQPKSVESIIDKSMQTKITTAVPVDIAPFASKLDQVMDAIKTRSYQSVKTLFTNNGYNVFDSIVHYGNAVVLQNSLTKAYSFSGGTMVRAAAMSFAFSNTKKKFTEDMVFYFNPQGLIDNITFGLSKSTIDGISSKPWSDNDKLTIINFLENYKTAYALKRANYIEKLYSDNALIIVGNVIKVYDKESTLSKTFVQKKQYTKKVYISNLKKSFTANEFINIKFEESEVYATECNSRRFYGIQLRQVYSSSSYGDEGFLFLLVDMQEPETPVIHVRTWQNERDFTIENNTNGLYGLGNFKCK